MSVYTEELVYHMPKGNAVKNITDDVLKVVRASGIREGTVTVQAPDSIAVVTTIEYEPGCLADLENALEKWAPFKPELYEHTKTWNDRNAHGHVRSAVMGCSETFVIRGGRVCIGTWQQIIYCDYCPNEHPEHPVYVAVLGE